MEGAVISSDNLTTEHGPSLPYFLQDFLDVLAKDRQGQRRIGVTLDTVKEQTDKMAAGVQAGYQQLLEKFYEALRNAVLLADNSNRLQRPELLRRAARVLTLALDAEPDLKELATRTKPDPNLHRTASHKLIRLTTSILRSHALLAAKVSKDSIQEVRGWFAPIERRRRRAELYSLLKQVRATNTSRLETDKAVQALLSDSIKVTGSGGAEIGE